MNESELYGKDGTPLGVFYCTKCKIAPCKEHRTPEAVKKAGNKKPLVYLAAPYTAGGMATAFTTLYRVLKINHAAASLFRRGFLVFSPISHTHPIKEACPEAMGGGWDFWKEYDTRMIDCCDEMIVFMLPGWEMSKGVNAEIKIAKSIGMRVRYMCPDTYAILNTPQ